MKADSAATVGIAAVLSTSSARARIRRIRMRLGKLSSGGGYLRYCTENRNWFEEDFPRFLEDAGRPLSEQARTDEHASHIVEALETGRVYRGHFNVRNGGIIRNLPADCIVESPGFVDRFGINMVEGITLPLACAATCCSRRRRVRLPSRRRPACGTPSAGSARHGDGAVMDLGETCDSSVHNPHPGAPSPLRDQRSTPQSFARRAIREFG